MTIQLDYSADVMRAIFGEYDAHIGKIERDLNVTIVDRDGAVRVSGAEQDAAGRSMSRMWTTRWTCGGRVTMICLHRSIRT